MNHLETNFQNNTSKHFKPRNSYFAALNTADGFQSRFDEIFSGVKRIIILKGGPGTGKSTLIRSVGAEAENREIKVEYFFCSSDSNSLDGVLIGDNNLAVIDGTSPHCVDPKIPGVRDEIINLGQFWNSSLLRDSSGDIEKYLKDIQRGYANVYESMKIARSAENLAEDLVFRHTDFEKLDYAAERIVRTFHADFTDVRYRGLSALGTRGYAFFDSYERRATEIYSFRDKHRMSHVFLDKIKEKLSLKKVGFDYSVSPIYCSTDGIFVRDRSIAFVAKECENDKVINMGRFISKSISAERDEIKRLRAISSHAIAFAEKKLSEIGELHDSLEKIYINAMDFKEMNKLTRKLLISIFKNQVT